MALVFLFELILVSALLLLGRMLMRRLLVEGTHVPTESALVVQGRPSSVPKDLMSGYQPKAAATET